MNLIKKFSSTLSNAKSSFVRFPIVMICTIATAFFFSLTIDASKTVENIYSVLSCLFFMGIFVYGFINLLLEGFIYHATDKEKLKKVKLAGIVAYLMSIPFLFVVYQTIYVDGKVLMKGDRGYFYFGFFLAFLVGCSFIAKIFYHSDYVAYVFKILQSALTSMTYSVIVYLGLCAIVFATVHLLGVPLKGSIYTKVGIFVFLPFNIGICLSSYPKVSESFIDYRYSKAFRFLLIYLLTPLCAIYMGILYLYFAKIILLQTLPKGLIVHLILWYALFSVFYVFFISRLTDWNFGLVFRKYFCILMLPLLGMMFFALWLRVSDYGITENRYFVMLGGIWCLLSFLYYILYRQNSNITVLILLCICVFISSVGPFSAYHVTRQSQNRHFIALLEKNAMINGNQIVPKGDISQEDLGKISGILNFMSKNHHLHELKYLPKDFELTDEKTKKVFGFTPNYHTVTEGLVFYNDQNLAINIEGYTQMVLVKTFNDQNEFGNYDIKKNGMNIQISLKKMEREIPIAVINMQDVKDKLRTLKEANSIINPEDISIKGESNGILYKIVFTELSFPNQEEDNFYSSFYLLTNQKG